MERLKQKEIDDEFNVLFKSLKDAEIICDNILFYSDLIIKRFGVVTISDIISHGYKLINHCLFPDCGYYKKSDKLCEEYLDLVSEIPNPVINNSKLYCYGYTSIDDVKKNIRILKQDDKKTCNRYYKIQISNGKRIES